MSESSPTEAAPSASAAAQRSSRFGGVDLRDAFYVLGLLTLVVAILRYAADQLAPIALAVLIWFLINAIAQGLRSAPGIGRYTPEWLAILLATIVTLGTAFLAGRLIYENISELGQGLAGIDVKAQTTIDSIETATGLSFNINIQALINDFKISEYLNQIIDAITATASNVSMVLLFVLFLIFDQPFYDAKIKALFPESNRREKVRNVLAKIGQDTRVYVWIMTVVSILVGLFTYGICAYFGVKGAVFWGFLAFALNYIPTIGSFVGVLFPSLFAFVQFDQVQHTLTFIAALGAVQFVMGNLLLPRMTGDRLNLSEFVVILSLLVWGELWGIAGMFLAVPLMMVLAIVLAQFDSTRAVAILLSKNGRVGRAEAPE